MIFKWLIRLLAILLIFGHLSLTALHLLPKNPISVRIGAVTSFYINSFFSQNWQLFAPEPGSSSTKFFYRCFYFDKWGGVLDPFYTLERFHYKTLISGVGKLVYVFNNVGRDFYSKKIHYENFVEEDLSKNFYQTKEFLNMRTLLRHLCYIENKDAIAGEVQVVRVYVKKFSERKETKENNIELLTKVKIGF